MRMSALAGILLLASLTGALAVPVAGTNWQATAGVESGTAPAPGGGGRRAVYFRCSRVSSCMYGDNPFSALSRTIPAQTWRGKRMRLSLLVKDEGARRSNVSLTLLNPDG